MIAARKEAGASASADKGIALPAGDPAALGFDPDRIARVAPAMQAFVDSGRVPNLVTLAARRGRVVHHHACGALDLDEDVPAGLDALFRMWSNTKPIAGAATLLLCERGALALDDPVAKFLPEYADMRVFDPRQPAAPTPAKRPITVRDCLTNTAGLADPSAMPFSYRERHPDALAALGWMDADGGPRARSNRELARAQAALPLAAHPGERFIYHMGYPVLSAVLEEASGKRVDALFKESLFDPLGMRDTGFYLREGQLPRFGACYAPREADGEMRLVAVEKAASSDKATAPRPKEEGLFAAGGDGGGVLSTAGDYARFGQMLLNGGVLDGARVLGRKSVALMTANHTGDLTIPIGGPGFHWGLGVAVWHGSGAPPRLRSVGSYGWDGAAGTCFFADPAEELLGVCLTQVLAHGDMPGNTYQEDFQRLVYQALT